MIYQKGVVKDRRENNAIGICIMNSLAVKLLKVEIEKADK